MIQATASSYKTALIPMSVTETTNFARMSEAKAKRDRDWQDLRAVLQWKLRARKFLVPFLKAQMRAETNPMSMRLASILRIVQGW